jgi:hypothetical protein
MYQIQYTGLGAPEAIPITYEFFSDARRDAHIMKPERTKQIVNLKTGETVWSTPVPPAIPGFLRF